MIQRFEAFVTGVTACYKYIQRIKSAEMTGLGLKGKHVMCLFFLHHNPEGLTAARLCRLCGEDKAAISRTLATLQELGYIRSGEKKYRAALQLTEDGLRVARQVDSLIEQWVDIGGDGLTEAERECFYRVLGLVETNLRESIEKKN